MAVAATLVETTTAETAVVVITTETVAAVPAMMITGLTGATVGAEATVSGLRARTAVVATPVTTIATAVAATPVTTATVKAIT